MILVTGGTGLVGSHLLFHLVSKGENVRAIRRDTSNIEIVRKVFGYYTDDRDKLFDQIEWVQADINNTHELDLAFKGVDSVYHSAALISFNPKDNKAMTRTNIEGTANIVNLCIDHRIKKLCYVSSVAAIDKAPGKAVYDESGQWNAAQNNYGYALTKYGGEMEVWRASAEGIPVVIVNPGVILGPGFWNNGPGAIFPKVYNGLRFYTEGITGYVGVTDVVKIMIALMEGIVSNERYILVSENRSFKDVLFMIADGFGKKRPSVKITPFMTAIGWRLAKLVSLFTGKSALLTKKSAHSLHSHVLYSAAKIEQELDYTFESLEKTIEVTCNIYTADQ